MIFEDWNCEEKITSTLSNCRICSSWDLVVYLDLGNLHLTGTFPAKNTNVPKLPLALAKCTNCGLTQLAHSMPIKDLYGEDYGYESHLNSQMRNYLISTARYLQRRFLIDGGDSVLDIASNDGTFLSGFSGEFIQKVGVDPLALLLHNRYPKEAKIIPDFFSSNIVRQATNNKFKLIDY